MFLMPHIGYLPVRGVGENSSFRDYIVDAVARGKSLGAMITFDEMLDKWNHQARGSKNGIFKNHIIYLVRKHKNFKRTRSEEDASNNPDSKLFPSLQEDIEACRIGNLDRKF